jgi:hypothetical protein
MPESTTVTPTEPETLSPENIDGAGTPAAPPAEEGKSIGDCLTGLDKTANAVLAAHDVRDIADAQIGDRMTHEVYGAGTVTSRNDITLWIRHDTQGVNEQPAMHGIEFSRKTLTFLSSDATRVVDLAQVVANSTAIPEAAVPLSAEEIDCLHTKAIFAHAAQGQMLAARARDLKQEQTNGQAALNEVHKALKEAQEAVVAHAEKVPTRGQFEQKTIEFNRPSSGTTSTAPVASDPGFHPGLSADQLIGLKDCGHTLQQLDAVLVEELKPGKRPKNLTKFAVEIRGAAYLVRQHSPDDSRWFLQALMDPAAWEQTQEAQYGRPVVNYDDNAEAKGKRQSGGPDCGRLVKIGKREVVLAPESMGLVVVASQEAAEHYRGWKKASEPVGDKSPDDAPEDDEGDDADEETSGESHTV